MFYWPKYSAGQAFNLLQHNCCKSKTLNLQGIALKKTHKTDMSGGFELWTGEQQKEAKDKSDKRYVGPRLANPTIPYSNTNPYVDWKYWTPVKNITKGGPGSMSYPRPVGCCKASDE